MLAHRSLVAPGWSPSLPFLRAATGAAAVSLSVLIPAPALAQPMIDSFETGSVHLSVDDGMVSQVAGTSSPGHCIAPFRTVYLTSYVQGAGPSTVDLNAWTTADDEIQIKFGNAGGEVILEYDMIANPVDLNQGGLNDRLDLFFHTETIGGTVEVRLWDVAAGYVQDSLVTAPGKIQFPFSAWQGQIDLGKIIFMQVRIRNSAASVYDILAIRVLRSDAFDLKFDVPTAIEIGPPYPIPPVLFEISDSGPPVERMGIGLLNAVSRSGSQVGISMEGSDSGGDPTIFGEVGQVAARWESVGPWEDSSFEIPVDVSAIMGVEPVPFLPTLPVVTMTPTGFLLSFDVWRKDPGSGAIVTTSRRQMSFDVPGPQGLMVIAPCVMPPPVTARAAGVPGYTGFIVDFDLAESGAGVDPGEPLIEVTFWGDCAPATATDAPVVAAAAAAGGPTITVRPSVTRAGAELLLASPARAAGAIDLFDVSGRLVRRLGVPAGSSVVPWDGRAAGGRAVSPGVYFLRYAGQRAGGSARVVVVR